LTSIIPLQQMTSVSHKPVEQASAGSTSVCTVTTLRASLETTLAFVNYHINLGIERLYLYFDDPADSAIEALSGYPQVVCIRCDEAHWPGGRPAREKLTLPQRQWFNAKQAWTLARTAGFGWILHIDSDELVHTETPFIEILANADKRIDVLRLRSFEAVPDKLVRSHPFTDVDCFKVGPSRPTRSCLPATASGCVMAAAGVLSYAVRTRIAAAMGCRSIRDGSYLRGHIGGKSAVRLSSEIGGMGVHVPTPPKHRRLRSEFVRHGGLLHFDASDYPHWRAKWQMRHGEAHVPPSRGENRAWQMRLFSAAVSTDREDALVELFKSQYFVAESERKTLKRLGLLRKIELDEAMFRAPEAFAAVEM
jgi:hypothetical protein